MTEILTPQWMNWPETRTLIAAFGDTPFRFVGGAVRDALLGRAVKDVDVATPLAPDAVMKKLEAAGIKVVPTGIDHGTVTAVVGKHHFEITTLRRDVATDGRRAVVAYTDDWKEDAQRRDFTMNALYLSVGGELFDYFDGEQDALAGRVRFIGDAVERIQEDALRILRYFRFFAHYGKGDPDIPGLAACGTRARDIEKLSGERIEMEMTKLLVAKNAADVVILMQQYNVWNHVGMHRVGVQGLRALQDLLRKAEHPPDAMLALAVLLATIKDEEILHTVAEAIIARWKLSKADSRRLRELVKGEGQGASGEAAWKKRIRKEGKELFIDRMLLQMTGGDNEEDGLAAIALANAWQVPVFPVTGDDLIAHGVKPGKEMGKMLRKLEEQWEAGGYVPGREELLAGSMRR